MSSSSSSCLSSRSSFCFARVSFKIFVLEAFSDLRSSSSSLILSLSSLLSFSFSFSSVPALRLSASASDRSFSSLTSSSVILDFASSMIRAGMPSFFEMMKALLVPDVPMMSLYVGLNVSVSNSQEAFMTPSVVTAYSLSSR